MAAEGNYCKVLQFFLGCLWRPSRSPASGRTAGPPATSCGKLCQRTGSRNSVSSGKPIQASSVCSPLLTSKKREWWRVEGWVTAITWKTIKANTSHLSLAGGISVTQFPSRSVPTASHGLWFWCSRGHAPTWWLAAACAPPPAVSGLRPCFGPQRRKKSAVWLSLCSGHLQCCRW